MSRHRDAAAVAITAVAYDKWQGYASYREVNRALREHGLSVQREDVERVGARHYFDVMTDPVRLEASLKAAATLATPDAGGMYYSQDEKGMAAFFTAAFAIFGISSASWYWLYFALYGLSVLVACSAFRSNAGLLFFFLALACAHELVAGLLPALPPQDINVIHGNRFIGIMASVAMCHLMFLILRRQPPTSGQVIAAAFQTVIICLVANARTSALWIPIAVAVLWAATWVAWLGRARRGSSAQGTERPRPVSWPMVVLVLGLGGFQVHQHIVQDVAFRDGRAHGGHVFWHNLTTALHNNPKRTERYGIPPEFPPYSDQVAYTVFDHEIARRGEDRARYLMGDSDWVYRTSSPDLDFRWAEYDRVLRDVFFRTVRDDPGYALRSFALEQPGSAFSLVLGPGFFRSRGLLGTVPILLFVLGAVLAAREIRARVVHYLALLAAVSFAVMLPVLFSAVAELRVVEMFYVLLLDAGVLATIGAVYLGRAVWSRTRHGRAA